MDAVFRAAAVYFALVIIFRFAGKRTLAQITTFDFILILIISEATQQALLGLDYSITNGFLVILSLVSFDLALSLLKRRFPRLEQVIEGSPIILVEDGKLLKQRMTKSRIDEGDILEAARSHHGLESLDQIKYAVLERSGGITIIPKRQEF